MFPFEEAQPAHPLPPLGIRSRHSQWLGQAGTWGPEGHCARFAAPLPLRQQGALNFQFELPHHIMEPSDGTERLRSPRPRPGLSEDGHQHTHLSEPSQTLREARFSSTRSAGGETEAQRAPDSGALDLKQHVIPTLKIEPGPAPFLLKPSHREVKAGSSGCGLCDPEPGSGPSPQPGARVPCLGSATSPGS